MSARMPYAQLKSFKKIVGGGSSGKSRLSFNGRCAMAESKVPNSLGLFATIPEWRCFPARSPGPLGLLDAGSLTVGASIGDTPGPLGIQDSAFLSMGTAASCGLFPGINDTLKMEEFRDSVLKMHIAGKVPAPELNRSEIGTVEGVEMKKPLAAIMTRLLANMRSDLQKQQTAFNLEMRKKTDELLKNKLDASGELFLSTSLVHAISKMQSKLRGPSAITHAIDVQSVDITSGYRGMEKDMSLWNDKFDHLYKSTRARRKTLKFGEWGSEAQKLILDHLRAGKSAPGRGNHSHGSAVDFKTTERGRKIAAPALLTLRPAVNKEYERTWLYAWLTEHQDEYSMHRIPSEAWHWEFD